MNRRDFIMGAGALGASPWVVTTARAANLFDPAWGRRPNARGWTFYNNDSTNLLSCTSPWSNPGNNPKPQVFSQRLIDASVAEVAGLVDVQLFCPGLCWVAWWKSEVYPAANHYKWYYQKFGHPGEVYDAYARYMLGGGDMVSGFLDACRRRGQIAFISFRLNDVQFLQTDGKTLSPTSKMCKFWYDHSARGSGALYTLGERYLNSVERAQNWAIPEVRAYKLALISEICRYDIDGLELDFNRSAHFFVPGSDAQTNQAIMVEFIRSVRQALDLGPDPAWTGQAVSPVEGGGWRRRYLSVRVPSFVDVHAEMGISLPQFVATGVDMVNVSDGYFTTNESDLQIIRASIPDTPITFEVTQATNWAADTEDGIEPFLRTTDQQFHTAADLAYRQGADGISVFNFAYYRQTSTGIGPFSEPPFHVLRSLHRPEEVARGSRWYVLAVDHNTYISPSMQMPQKLKVGDSYIFELSMYPREAGLQAVVRVRVAPPSGYTGGPVAAWGCDVELNGILLALTDYVAAPLPDPYCANLAVDKSRFCCFAATSGMVIEGRNSIKVTLVQPNPGSASMVTIDYLDVAWAQGRDKGVGFRGEDQCAVAVDP